MAARLGIELSSVICRIIEIEEAAAGGDRPRTRVRDFASIPSAEFASSHPRLASLRGRHANVVLWTAHSTYRQVTVQSGPFERMHSDALRGAAPSGMGSIPVLSDITPAAPFTSGASRRTVLLASAPRTEVAEALQPLRDAGIVVDAILTPGAALASLARLKNGPGLSSGLEAYWAIEETASTLALIRDGHLLSARTAPWGYLSELSSRASAQPRPRAEITMRLAEDIAACLASVQPDPGRLTQVCVCGGLPDLRNMTLPLMEQLDVEVEPLDTLFAIDPSPLPGRDGDLQERAAAFRLAWAAASDDSPVLNLTRGRHRQQRKAISRQVAIAAGVLVGLGMGWVLQRQWRPAPTSVRKVAEGRESSRPAAVVPSAAPRVAPAPLAPPRAAFEPGSEVILPGQRATVARPVSTSGTRVVPDPPSAAREPAAPRVVPTSSTALPSEPVTPVATPLPFDAALGTILYGPERKLAIVDGRIVQAGDDVRGAIVVEITPTAVYLRDAQGRLRRLTAGGTGR